MTTIDRDSIHQKTNNKHLLRHFCAGARAVQHNPLYIMLLAIYLLTVVLLWTFRDVIFGIVNYGTFAPAMDRMLRLLILAYGSAGLFVILVIMGTPPAVKAPVNLCKRREFPITQEKHLFLSTNAKTRTILD